MPHKKMTAFTALTTVAADDIMIVDDTSAVETKKVTLENLLSIINVLTAEATIDGAADYVAVWDTSAAAIRKALPNNLPVPTGALNADGSVPLTANWDAGAFEIRAQTFQSDVATGTAPIIVASTTVVANLNADKVDGTDVNDAGSTTSDLWTANKIQAVVDAAVAGLYDHKGAYNASTNSPDLDTSPSGILKGDAYTVSVAGTFFTAAVDAGDVLIADQDSPTLESHWTIVNRNIDETAFAPASHTHTASDVTDFSEAVDDRAAALVIGGTDITVTYDDGAGTLTIDSTAGGGSTLPVVDTTGIAKGSVDATKIVRLEVDGLTTGTTRVLTVQDADGTIALSGDSIAASQVASGTLDDARISESSVTQHEAALTIATSNRSIVSSSGVFEGGVLSVGSPNTTFSISDGSGYVLDTTTSPASPTLVKVEWSGLANLAVTNLATSLITFVSMDSGGNVIQRTSRWTPDTARSEIILGVVVHVDNTIVDTVNNEQSPVANPVASCRDLFEAFKFINKSGNSISANGANLSIDKSSGVLTGFGINWDNDADNPHNRTMPILSPATFQYRFSDGTNGVTGTLIDPDNLDNGSGGLTAVGSNRWSIQRVYQFTSNNIKIQRGVADFPTKDAAIAGASSEAFITESSIAANGILRSLIVIKKGATDLSDSSQAVFVAASKIGESGGGSGGGSTLPVVDTTGIAKGSVDATKIVRLEVDGLTTGTTRVLTVQDADGTIELTGHSHSASNITSGTLTHERGGLEADVSAYAGVALIDSGTTSELKYNLTATTDPGVGDDSVDGYTVGSRWVNVTLDKEFVCLDASTGAAVWTETTAAAGGSGGSCCGYGGLRETAATAANITTATKLAWSSTMNTETGGVDANSTTDKITVTDAGVYRIDALIQVFNTISLYRTATIRIYKNGTEIVTAGTGTIATGGEPQVGATLNDCVTLAASDYLELYISADGASGDITVVDCDSNYFSVQKVG